MNSVPRLAVASLLLLASLPALPAETNPSPIPPRVAEEAGVLAQNATRILTRETLVQRSLLPPSRFRPRSRSEAERAAGLRFRVREVVSEFSFGALRKSPTHDIIEFRQVLSIDGHPLESPDSALRALSQGIQQGDDRSRKRMLEQFARSGLVDIATDYALILLAFSSHGQKLIEFSPSGRCYVGSAPALSFTWRQKSPQGGLTEFHGPESVHRALEGTLWVRSPDGLPLRVHASMEYTDRANQVVRDEATVDYAMSVHGFLTPASVIHIHKLNGATVTENLYSYEPFQLFSASSTITFGDPK